MRRWTAMSGWERLAVLALWAVGFAVFYEIRSLRASLVGSVLIWALAAPVFFVVYSALAREFRLVGGVWALQVWRAMRRQELVLHYQPIAQLQTGGQILKMEALARWNHPKRGLLEPHDWLPRVEATWIASRLNLHLLALALSHKRGWQDKGHQVEVAVNLSPECFGDQGLPEKLGRLLEQWQVPPESIHVEVTELAFGSGDEVEGVIEGVKGLGVRLALDDFGTGHSSLARLAALHFDVLKIDRLFVGAMVGDARKAAIVQSAVTLAHTLDAVVVAEGIEDEETWTAARLAGCHAGQGYLISRPMPSAEVPDFLVRHRRRRFARDVGASEHRPAQ